jgi:hypothetical protein
MSETHACRACQRGQTCDACNGMGCGACIRTGVVHTFAEAIECLLKLTPSEADEITRRITDRL